MIKSYQSFYIFRQRFKNIREFYKFICLIVYSAKIYLYHFLFLKIHEYKFNDIKKAASRQPFFKTPIKYYILIGFAKAANAASFIASDIVG